MNLQEVTLHSNMDSDPPYNEYAPLDLRTLEAVRMFTFSESLRGNTIAIVLLQRVLRFNAMLGHYKVISAFQS